MTTPRAVCLSLELDVDGERVTGSLADDEGNDWAVSCWLDLLTVIERALAGARAGGPSERIQPPRRHRPAG